MDHKKLRWLFLAVVLVLAWTRACGSSAPASVDLLGQPWLERMPRSPTDVIAHLFFAQQNGRSFGGQGNSSAYRLNVDFFEWKLEGEHLELHLLQEDQRRRYQPRAWACADAPKGFDLCLELRGEQGQVLRYYSNKAWRSAARFTADTGFQAQGLSP